MPTELDDMHCAVCGKYVFDTSIESYMVYQWSVDEQRNVFYAIYCSEDKPVR